MSIRSARRRIFSTILLVIVLIVPIGSPVAQADRPLLADTSVNIDIFGQRFSVPFRFLNPPEGIHKLQPINHWQSFHLAFWMPEGNSINLNLLSNPGLRPALKDGLPRQDDEFIVRVLTMRSFLDVNCSPAVDSQLDNIIRYQGDYYNIKDVNGVKFIDPKDNTKTDFHFFYGSSDKNVKYLIRCMRHGVMNPACDGDIDFYDYNLKAHVIFPEDRELDIPKIAGVLEHLLAGWRTPS